MSDHVSAHDVETASTGTGCSLNHRAPGKCNFHATTLRFNIQRALAPAASNAISMPAHKPPQRPMCVHPVNARTMLQKCPLHPSPSYLCKLQCQCRLRRLLALKAGPQALLRGLQRRQLVLQAGHLLLRCRQLVLQVRQLVLWVYEVEGCGQWRQAVVTCWMQRAFQRPTSSGPPLSPFCTQ